MPLQRPMLPPVADHAKSIASEHLARFRAEQNPTCASGEQVATLMYNGTKSELFNGVALTPFRNPSDLEGNSANLRDLSDADQEPDKPDTGSDLYTRTDISPEELFRTLGRLRSEAEAEIERLLIFLDELDADTDLEPSGDEGEPDLGSVPGRRGFDQSMWSAGNNAVDGGEPSLGASENHPNPNSYHWNDKPYRDQQGTQLGWATGNGDDREGASCDDDREPNVDDELSGDENESQLGSFDRLLNQEHGWRQTSGGPAWPAHLKCNAERDMAR